MKQFLFIIFLIIISFIIFPDDFLITSLSFQIGYLPNWNINYGINDYEIKELKLNYAYEIEFKLDLYFINIFFIKGSIKNIFHEKKYKLSFSPDCDHYLIACGIRYKYFEIGYEHLCFHPIFPFSANNRERNNALYEGSYHKYYLEIKLQSKL